MESFFPGPDVERFPPKETHIVNLKGELVPEFARVRVQIEVTPFQQRPTLEITLTDAAGEELSSASIVEPVGWKLEINLHIRKQPSTEAGSKIEPSSSKYLLSASLNYPELGEVDRRQVSVTSENH